MSDPATLPLVPGGLIWDGVTEYQNVYAGGSHSVWWLCRMYGDGTRRFSESQASQDTRCLYDWMVSAGPRRLGKHRRSHRGSVEPYGLHRNGGFLNYDGTLSAIDNPPNQHYQLQNFSAPTPPASPTSSAPRGGHHSLQAATEEDRLTVHRTLCRHDRQCSAPVRPVGAVKDPEELIVGGAYDGTLLWKRYEPEYVEIDEALCGQCEAATFARRFLKRADLPAFRRAWRQGIIYSADRSVTPWAPEFFDAATPPAEDYYDALDAAYDGMIDLYDSWWGRRITHDREVPPRPDELAISCMRALREVIREADSHLPEVGVHVRYCTRMRGSARAAGVAQRVRPIPLASTPTAC